MKTLPLFIGVCLILYLVVRVFFSVFFTKLTAHWVSLGVAASYVLGLMFGPLFGLHHEGNIARALGNLALLYVIALNLIVLPALYGWDKRLSRSTGESTLRIPENALHALTFLGGALGSKIGQSLFKHKRAKATYQSKHRWMLMAAVTLYCLLAYVLFT